MLFLWRLRVPEILREPFSNFISLRGPSEVPLFSRRLGKAAHPMDSNAILHEVRQLYNVSDRLDSLAERHPVVSEALITISGRVRSTATLLEVLVAMKITPLPD
jgi:hypothetical protein